jgi:hypothetical protein
VRLEDFQELNRLARRLLGAESEDQRKRAGKELEAELNRIDGEIAKRYQK